MIFTHSDIGADCEKQEVPCYYLRSYFEFVLTPPYPNISYDDYIATYGDRLADELADISYQKVLAMSEFMKDDTNILERIRTYMRLSSENKNDKPETTQEEPITTENESVADSVEPSVNTETDNVAINEENVEPSVNTNNVVTNEENVESSMNTDNITTNEDNVEPSMNTDNVATNEENVESSTNKDNITTNENDVKPSVNADVQTHNARDWFVHRIKSRRNYDDDECHAEVTFGPKPTEPSPGLFKDQKRNSPSYDDMIPIADLKSFIEEMKNPNPSFKTLTHECFYDKITDGITCIKRLNTEINWEKIINSLSSKKENDKTQNKDETTSSINVDNNNNKIDNDTETPIKTYAYNPDSDISFDYYVIRTYNWSDMCDLLLVIYNFYFQLIKFMLMVLTS